MMAMGKKIATRESYGNTLVELAKAVSYTHLRAHETGRNLVCRLLLEKKKKKRKRTEKRTQYADKQMKLK